MKYAFFVLLLLCAALPSRCQAQDRPDKDKQAAEALRQEVSAASTARRPLKADLIWIKSYYDYSPQFTTDTTNGSAGNNGPTYQRSKTPLVVIRQAAGLDQFVSTRGKPYKAAPSDLLRHLGDPFIPCFLSGIPGPSSSTIYIGDLHSAGTETKNGAEYRVLEANVIIVSASSTSPQVQKVPQAPKARFTATHWKWDIGSDNLIHRFTWENHEDESAFRSVEQNEIIVDKYYFP